MKQGLFIASTGQNVGKTTCTLGLFAALSKRFQKVSYLKPVGQEYVTMEGGTRVDKDVLLFKNHFCLSASLESMSPLVIPPRFTRSYLDGAVDTETLFKKLVESFEQEQDFITVEGSGHVGVGSVLGINNAEVARRLNLPIVIIAPGGIGSTFDLLSLNLALCEKVGAKVIGVILNKVLPDKLEEISTYMAKALERYDLPLLGAIPYNAILATPTLRDFEQLFDTRLLSGEDKGLACYPEIRMIATSNDVYEKSLRSELIITHSTREDIVLTALNGHRNGGHDIAILLTGKTPMRQPILDQVKDANIPCLFTDSESFEAMKKISGFIAKISAQDTEKINEAIQVVERSVDLSTLLQKASNA